MEGEEKIEELTKQLQVEIIEESFKKMRNAENGIKKDCVK